MRVIAQIRSVALLAPLLACREELPAFEPAWPPEAGAYCGAAGDFCDPEGTPWLCGPRPYWQRVDCAAFCASRGGAPHGCFIQEPRDVAAARRRLAPLGFLEDAGPDARLELSSARCLCSEPSALECGGPDRAICANRREIWSCDEMRRWEKHDCASKCAALDPPMVAEECEHSGDHDQDRCRCTLLGAPCSTEDALVCGGGATIGGPLWLRCVDGAWQVELSCSTYACEPPEIPACDHFRTDPPACRCEGGE